MKTLNEQRERTIKSTRQSPTVVCDAFQETLQSRLLQLTEECSGLRSAQHERLSTLQANLQAQTSRQTYSTVEELTESRRHSCGDIQQYLQGSLKALEERCKHATCYHVISSKTCTV